MLLLVALLEALYSATAMYSSKCYYLHWLTTDDAVWQVQSTLLRQCGICSMYNE